MTALLGGFSFELSLLGGGVLCLGGSTGSRGGGGGIRDMMCCDRHGGICFEDMRAVEGMKWGGESAKVVVSSSRLERNASRIGASSLYWGCSAGPKCDIMVRKMPETVE